MLRHPRPHAVRRSGIATAIAVAALSLTATGLGGTPAAAETVGPDGQPITNARGVTFVVVAHRGGGAQERPENSVEAYQYSVAQGFDGIETDLLFTSDGRGVMSHNDTLPTRCTRAGQRIHLLTLAQVRGVRCEDFRTGEKTVPIPTFDEFAAAVKGSDIKVDLDIKTWSGQPASGERLYAARAIKLLKANDLLERASIVSFRWDTILPTVRKLAPNIRVVGLDNKPMDLGRVRLAASLGADGFGIKAANSPANLMKYIRAKGMDPMPWEVRGEQHQAYSFYFGGKLQGLLSDKPSLTREQLVSGQININPTIGSVVTKLPAAVTIAKKATYSANSRKYPRVMGTAVPWAKLAMLDSVAVRISVSNGPGTGYISIGAADSPISSSVKVRLPRGSKSLLVKVPVGNGGKLRVFASRRATFKLSVVEYTNLTFS